MTGGTEPAAYQQGERTNHSDNACHAQITVKLNSCCWKQAPQTVMLKLYALVADEGVGKKEEVLWEGRFYGLCGAWKVIVAAGIHL